jgi:hypothetical protein
MRTFMSFLFMVRSGGLFAVLIASSFASCHSGDTPNAASALTDSTRFTTIQWLDSSYRDFGRITEGKKLDVAFRFRNTGNTPLVIARVQPSCGCTIAEQPREPIAPGAEGQIRATFNSEGRTGVNQKTLFVTANTKGTQNYSLRFSVVVDKKPS